ncbi:MAG: class I SAM-dependent RNA methyltransferase [Verrucomicrobiales bacterium]
MPELSTVPRGFRPEPFSYHQQIELEISTLTNQGQGLGRIDNWVVLVPFALPGELVRARVYRNHKNYSEADLVEVLRRSPHRVEPRCPLFGECGGCQYQNFAYPEQLAWKLRQVGELLRHMAGIEAEVNQIISSPLEYGYRSKITPHFRKPRDGRISEIGFLRAGNRSRIVDVPACPIASPAINLAYGPLREKTRRSAASYRRGATLLLRDSRDHVETDPKQLVHEEVGEFVFEFVAGEFFQNNPHILPKFVEYVRDQASGAGDRFLVDAYCGSGLFCLSSASAFERAVGVEINEKAVAQAIRNAKINGVTNVAFLAGSADAIFRDIDFFSGETAVIIDPPRKGCDQAFLSQLIAFRPRTVVYVSCNPATQMRDLKPLLEDGNYRLETIQPFDLFPQTKHLECVMTLRAK